MNITGGKYNGRKISVPDESITRPTLSKVRMGVFNTLYSILGTFENKTFLDFFAGSGIMGLEALSRGFKEVYAFEQNSKVIQIIKKNYEILNEKLNLKKGDSLKLITNTDLIFDVIYIDPPYNSGLYEPIFNILYKICKEKELTPIIIAEHSENIFTDKFTLIKSKNYGGKKISFYKFKIQSER